MNPNPNPSPRRPLWFRVLRGFLFLGISLVTLGALVWAFENWRGERAWQALVREHAAKGDPLDGPLLVPEKVPDDQNAAMTPLLRPLREFDRVNGEIVWRDSNALARFNALALPQQDAREARTPEGRTALAHWQTAFRSAGDFPLPASPGTPEADILAALGRWKAELDELDAASRQPHARFQQRFGEDVDMLLPQLAAVKKISNLLQLRCAARLAAGDTEGALADIEFNERWARALSGDPLVITELVAIAIESIGTRMAWEGLVDHRWNDAQLQRLQGLFAARRPREDLVRAMRGERRFALAQYEGWVRNTGHLSGETAENLGFPHPARSLPRGWVRQNQISLVRYHEILAARYAQWIAGDLPAVQAGEDPVDQLKRERPGIYAKLTLMLAPAYARTMEKTDWLLTITRMAEIACALERYRLVHAQYPESLDALTPSLISALPSDPCTGKPFQYRRTGDAMYQLYSLGLNGRDDGGKFVRDDAVNDWAWPMAVPMDRKERMF
ncbi:MAG: hypothetical protein KIT22_04290 [Verrucomicrobiae bacterium]|nr:hypothetical protein [Verrucomicrobiae bacterium]